MKNTHDSAQAAIDEYVSSPDQWGMSLSGTRAIYRLEGKFARLVGHPHRLDVIGLVNPSFEEGLDGWHRQEGDAGAVVGCDGGVVPMWGPKMFGWTNKKKGEGSRPTIYQQCKVTRGQTYCFSGSVYTDHVGG